MRLFGAIAGRATDPGTRVCSPARAIACYPAALPLIRQRASFSPPLLCRTLRGRSVAKSGNAVTAQILAGIWSYPAFLRASIAALLMASSMLAAVGIRAEDGNNGTLARGKYLVERVSMCGDCHTPRAAHGRPDRARFLDGATLGFISAHAAGLVRCAPPIAGLRFWTAEQSVKFLETGITPGGAYAKPPMPAYRLAHDDAVAVVKYLRSLRSASSDPCVPEAMASPLRSSPVTTGDP